MVDILPYCLAYFGGTATVVNNMLFINVDDDTFKLSLLDKKKLGSYTIFHQNKAAHDGFWHTQFKARDLDYSLFKIFTHSFNKKNGIPYSNLEDLRYFRRDSLRYNELMEETNANYSS